MAIVVRLLRVRKGSVPSSRKATVPRDRREIVRSSRAKTAPSDRAKIARPADSDRARIDRGTTARATTDHVVVIAPEMTAHVTIVHEMTAHVTIARVGATAPATIVLAVTDRFGRRLPAVTVRFDRRVRAVPASAKVLADRAGVEAVVVRAAVEDVDLAGDVGLVEQDAGKGDRSRRPVSTSR